MFVLLYCRWSLTEYDVHVMTKQAGYCGAVIEVTEHMLCTHLNQIIGRDVWKVGTGGGGGGG